jgi:hypothetical protein
MKAILKEIHSPDIDLSTFHPPEPDNFGFLLQAMIGPDNQEGAESFGIQVCTPSWLNSHYSGADILHGEHMLIVFEYNIHKIKSHISNYCNRCTGENWQEIAEKLCRLGQWEFEDYIENTPTPQ